MDESQWGWRVVIALAALLPPMTARLSLGDELKLQVEQITHGDHHLFGYIGQCRTIPWNASGRYIVALRSAFHDRMPRTGERADIVLIDTRDDYRVVQVDSTGGWNLQQGTMLYWNPKFASSQFFFNDRDPRTNKVLTVLYDIDQRKRIKEFRFEETPVANGGVAQAGGYFVAINYARMARFRPVTGYPESFDWTVGENAPGDDGVFRVDVATGKKQLLVSFKQLADFLRPTRKDIDDLGMYINHTLCSRSGDHISFFVRGRQGSQAMALNVLCTIRPDGSNLRLQQFIGGHPEWSEGDLMIGAVGNRQVLYDVHRGEVVGQIGDEQMIPKPGADVSLSPDGRRFVNGYSTGAENRYVIVDLTTRAYATTGPFPRGPYTKGSLRIDPAPRWNRTNDAILVPGFTPQGTRQMFLVRIID